MDYLKTYEGFDLMSIFNSRDDDIAKQLLIRIKQYYKSYNLSKEGDGTIVYILGRDDIDRIKGIKIESKINSFKVGGKDINCSWFLKRRTFKFLESKLEDIQ